MSSFTKMGITIGGVHSYDDLGLYLADRSVTQPERKTNFVSIPYMDGYYDFGSTLGAYYGSRTLTYSFDIMADDEVEVEALRQTIYDWAKTAVESPIYDDADPDYYFIGSFTSESYTANGDLPEFGGQVTLTFTAQPYRYARSAAIVITKQPEDYIGAVGDSVSLTVEAEGEDLSYQWQLSDDGGTTWTSSTATSASTNTYTTTLTEARSGRMLRCVITDTSGNSVTSNTVTIMIG
ncbi:MAG: phage tail family protein [Lachnospiraceae bacterium]|nr:phage tail family protein [Lachnospiraceae bacterium]